MRSSAMRPGARLLRLLLALLLCLQSGLAAAHCLRLAAPQLPSPAAQHAPFQLEICTADGLAVSDLGGTDHGAPVGHDHAGFCLACHGLPQIVLPAPVAVPLPLARPVAAPQAAADAVPPHGARAPPYSCRAPPAFS